MLHLPYSTKRKRMINPVVGAIDPSVNLDSACKTTQQLSNSAEQNCKWLIASTRVLCMGPQAQ